MISFDGFRPEDGSPIYLQIIRFVKQGIVSGEIADGDELLRWLLTFGDQAELLEPADLRRELGALAKKISEKYDS